MRDTMASRGRNQILFNTLTITHNTLYTAVVSCSPLPFFHYGKDLSGFLLPSSIFAYY